MVFPCMNKKHVKATSKHHPEREREREIYCSKPPGSSNSNQYMRFFVSMDCFQIFGFSSIKSKKIKESRYYFTQPASRRYFAWFKSLSPCTILPLSKRVPVSWLAQNSICCFNLRVILEVGNTNVHFQQSCSENLYIEGNMKKNVGRSLVSSKKVRKMNFISSFEY